MAKYEFAVEVRTQYLPEQSNPDRTNFVFTYTITIKNTGTVPAQLISRHWVITDANNHGHKGQWLDHRDSGNARAVDLRELNGSPGSPFRKLRAIGGQQNRFEHGASPVKITSSV